MIPPERFEDVRYLYPKLQSRGEEITEVWGLDSEAYADGVPFVICLSDGTELDPGKFPHCLLERFSDRERTDLSVYNLKYDSGAMLYHAPDEVLERLRVEGEGVWDGVKLEYIPHKYLSFAVRKCKIRIWDVSQYYRMSLNNAAKRYLGKQKIDIETKKFSRAYVKRNRSRIVRYCVYDAKLCEQLTTFLISKLSEFGIRATALYSSASLSFRYFADRCRIVTSWRYWKHYRRVLRFAVEAYQGGKFEVTARGSFTGHEYDLVSAYPYEIANLVDISTARVRWSRRYQKDAVYGFLRVRIVNTGKHVPSGIMMHNVRVYPMGEFFTTVTKAEYDYMTGELGLCVDIVEGVWLFVLVERYPYRKTIGELFALKAEYKGKDAMLTEVSKRMLNSFYGKTVQAIEDHTGTIVAGAGWNPMYGAIITANTRLAVTRVQNEYGADCLAVHTDSVILTRPLTPARVTGKLGGFDFVTEGPGVLVACGQYEIGDQCAYKGFDPVNGETWFELLDTNRNRQSFLYPVLKVDSWIESSFRGKRTINLFHHEKKRIDLNGDTKRVWLRTVRGRDLLGPLEQSTHKVLIRKGPPDTWTQ